MRSVYSWVGVAATILLLLAVVAHCQEELVDSPGDEGQWSEDHRSEKSPPEMAKVFVYKVKEFIRCERIDSNLTRCTRYYSKIRKNSIAEKVSQTQKTSVNHFDAKTALFEDDDDGATNLASIKGLTSSICMHACLNKSLICALLFALSFLVLIWGLKLEIQDMIGDSLDKYEERGGAPELVVRIRDPVVKKECGKIIKSALKSLKKYGTEVLEQNPGLKTLETTLTSLLESPPDSTASPTIEVSPQQDIELSAGDGCDVEGPPVGCDVGQPGSSPDSQTGAGTSTSS